MGLAASAVADLWTCGLSQFLKPIQLCLGKDVVTGTRLMKSRIRRQNQGCV